MRNVFVLTIAQFLGSFGQVTMVILAGIIGADLAPNASMATLPVTFGVLGIAAATIPAALFMQRVGRRAGFITGCIVAAGGSLLAVQAVTAGNFIFFCTASFLMGTNLALIAQYRFAAAESVATEQVSKAIGILMMGTLAGAVTGPWLAVHARWWLEVEFAGSFMAVAAIYALCIVCLIAYQEQVVDAPADALPQRPMKVLARQPKFIVAIIMAAGAYAVMSMIMTATPLSMHVLDGHSVEATAMVIQGHVLAMYLPSLASAWIIARMGITKMLSAGLIIESLCILFSLSGNEIIHYWGGLVALGLGWNLLFIASTTLLTQTYQPSERFKVQALNEFSMFGIMAIASLLAGWLISLVGWQMLNLLALLPLGIMAGGIALLIARR